jgi:hypothetical protein
VTDWLKLKDAVRLMCREGLISIAVSNDFLAAMDAGHRAEGMVDLSTRERPILLAEMERLRAEVDRHSRGAEEFREQLQAVKAIVGLLGGGVGVSVAETVGKAIAEARGQGYRDGVEAAARWLEADGMLREGGVRAIRALGATGGTPCPECLGLGWDNACDDLGTVKCPKCHGGGRV